ncbi:acetyl-CoA carboxylase carboxyltransferase subunit alpha [Candidatus Magnetomonas plexicatena]|uniref:acetyl-CoA carboxylase carboxyltransferase subunit alpha n=1 Tax=Candidatus Magnetomonas plexicatena TaxID=2552947 RepID=UPI001104AD80|nr:acetyl-CoA carboxylase carboxyltransferase subunit alpha [Nitrospirales bacterium LBB_01]
MRAYLDFEKPLEELELKIAEMQELQISSNGLSNGTADISSLTETLENLRKEIFKNLTPWQKCQLARHPDRPYTMDYINKITDTFIELHGDRRFSDDLAVVGGLATIGGISVLIVGHQKGRGIKDRIIRNFGQPNPEGYRKALRLMKLAQRFDIPIVTFIDTPGAYPGIGAEERGQAEAIAVNLMEISMIDVPIISLVIGEGGSGGALALSVSDRLVMLEHSIYSVISPEGCAAILWNSDKGLNQEDFAKAAEALKLTAKDLLKFDIIDTILPEPPGGAHADPGKASITLKNYIIETIKYLRKIPRKQLLKNRQKKLRTIGSFSETRP